MAGSFSFGFGGDDIEQEVNEEGIATEHAQIPEHHDPISQPQVHAMKDLLASLPSRLSFSSVITQTSDGRTISIPRRELFDIRAQLMAEDSSSGRDPIAGLSDNDIKPYVYEGGFKTWECSVDLANYLAEMLAAEEETMLTSALDIVELGAGSALPSLLLFDHILSRLPVRSQGTPPINLTLCDYNLSVLKLATIPNLILTWCARQCFLPLALDGDFEITSVLCDRFLQDLESRNIRITCISGAWSPRFLDLVPKPPSQLAYHVRTMVLASETIYSLATLSSFVETLLSVLQTSIAGGTSAVGLVAAKKVYFGVGGGVDEFVRVLAEHDGKANVVWESKGAGVGRVILEVSNG